MSIAIQPYSLNVPQDVLDDLRERLERTRLPGSVSGTGWSRGVDFDYMEDLIDYWIHEYDWREQEARLNRYRHLKADVDGLGIHFIHEEGKGPNPMPLFMMHGYPWSLILLLRILPMLTDPASYGGDPADAFTVVIPSIIGFGFSDYPNERGFGFQHHPSIYDKLMTKGARLRALRNRRRGLGWFHHRSVWIPPSRAFDWDSPQLPVSAAGR